MNIRLIKEINIFLILFFSATFITFIILNGDAFMRDIKYALVLNSPFTDPDLKQGEILEVPLAMPSDNTNRSSQLKLVIPKINVNVPIVASEGESKKEILSSLEKGVGLYPGSVYPGENGRAVILGHSSRASWYKGEYALVFTLLSKLDPPDEFYVTTKEKKYVYQVFAHKTLTPDDTNTLLSGAPVESEIDLITCYPIGGASKRTVIQAKLIRIENI